MTRTEMNPMMNEKPQVFEMLKWNGEEFECVAYITTKEQYLNFIKNFPHESIRKNSYCPKTNTTTFIVK